MTRGLMNVLAVAVLAILAVSTFRAKTEAEADRARLAALEAERAERARALIVLRAEIANLEDPGRLRALAESELGLKPVDPLRVVGMDEAALLLEPIEPLLAEDSAGASVARAAARGDEP